MGNTISHQVAIQEKYPTQEQAIKRAKELSMTNDYVAVILSKGKYYVENEPHMIRVWEHLVKTFEK